MVAELLDAERLPAGEIALVLPSQLTPGFVARLRKALEAIGSELKSSPRLLPPRYTGFVARDNAFYRPIRDAGLETGKLAPAKR